MKYDFTDANFAIVSLIRYGNEKITLVGNNEKLIHFKLTGSCCSTSEFHGDYASYEELADKELSSRLLSEVIVHHEDRTISIYTVGSDDILGPMSLFEIKWGVTSRPKKLDLIVEIDVGETK